MKLEPSSLALARARAVLTVIKVAVLNEDHELDDNTLVSALTALEGIIDATADRVADTLVTVAQAAKTARGA